MSFLKSLYASKTFKVLVAVTVVATIGSAANKLIPSCTHLPNFSSPYLALAISLGIVYRVINATGWTIVLASMQQKVGIVSATQLWLLSESNRWLPGGVWGYSSRILDSSNLGVTKTVATASIALELLATVAAALVLCLPLASFYFDKAELVLQDHGNLLGLTLAGLFLVTFYLNTKRQFFTNFFERIKGTFEGLRTVKFDFFRMLLAVLFFVLTGFLNGLVTYWVALSFELVESPDILLIVTATSFAWVAGLVAIAAPGGILVREATFAACVSICVPYSTGIAIAVVARLVQLIAEVAGLVLAWSVETPFVRNRFPITVIDP